MKCHSVCWYSILFSLLLEDSEDEEGDICRICQMSSASSDNLLIEPCKCTGSLQYVHQECMKKWLQSKINSGKANSRPRYTSSYMGDLLEGLHLLGYLAEKRAVGTNSSMALPGFLCSAQLLM